MSEFHKHAKRADGLQVYCKSCRAVIDHERYLRQHGARTRRRVFAANRANANWMRELKSGRPCADCGRTFPPEVMQWDHLPGTRKLGNLSTHFRGRSRAAILEELAKCELVCANCHAMRTFERAGWGLPGYEKIGWISDLVPSRSRTLILEELRKCELVCANCHVLRTITRAGRSSAR